MELVKKTNEYSVFKKKNGRYGVKGANKKWINGDEKVKILLKEGLIKAPEPKKAEEAPVEEEAQAAAEETTEEAPAEETSEEAQATE